MSEHICERLLWPGTHVSPPEYCENEAMDGEEFCEFHIPREDYEDFMDRIWDDA